MKVKSAADCMRMCKGRPPGKCSAWKYYSSYKQCYMGKFRKMGHSTPDATSGNNPCGSEVATTAPPNTCMLKKNFLINGISGYPYYKMKVKSAADCMRMCKGRPPGK